MIETLFSEDAPPAGDGPVLEQTLFTRLGEIEKLADQDKETISTW